jgi:hypothetical protein
VVLIHDPYVSKQPVSRVFCFPSAEPDRIVQLKLTHLI